MKNIKIYVDEDDLERLDSYISKELEEMSRNRIQSLIKEKLVLVNKKEVKPSYLVKEGDLIELELPEFKEPEILPENLEIDIVYEDKDLCIINKPQSMVVHPAVGNYSGTLVNALLFHVKDLSNLNGEIRPGIVHRLDKDTSGLLIVAKNNSTHEALSKALKARTVERIYTALVHGVLKDDMGTIDAPIGRHPKDRKKMTVIDLNGKNAKTYYRVLERFNDYTLIEAQLETGRTHQIRVHMEYINHPIVGDSVYSRRKNEFGLHKQMLHSTKIGFLHPGTEKCVEFKIDLPEYFKKILKTLENKRK